MFNVLFDYIHWTGQRQCGFLSSSSCFSQNIAFANNYDDQTGRMVLPLPPMNLFSVLWLTVKILAEASYLHRRGPSACSRNGGGVIGGSLISQSLLKSRRVLFSALAS